MSPVDKVEIEKIILLLNSKKSNNIYGVFAGLLKCLAKHVSPVLSSLFNESIGTGLFPDHMKLAMITRVYKVGSKLDISPSRSSRQECSVKKVFLETSQNSQENTCARASFLIKLQVFFNKF